MPLLNLNTILIILFIDIYIRDLMRSIKKLFTRIGINIKRHPQKG